MMKFLCFFLLSSLANAGLPPTTIQGQADANAKTKFAFQVPNSQATDLGGIKALLETGSKNVLANHSFENTTFDSGWTTTTTVSTKETTVIQASAGKQAALLTFTSSTGDIAQTITPSGKMSGQNWEASCSVNAGANTTIQVCGIVNAVEQNCTNVPAISAYAPVTANIIPADSQSVGVRVKTTASMTGTVYVDDCYVGPARNTGTVAQASAVGTLLFTPATTSCSWAVTQTTYAADFSATSACPTATVTGSVTSPSKKPWVDYNNAPPGTYLVTYESNTAVGAGNPLCRIIDDQSNVLMETGPSQPSGGQSMVISGAWTYTSAGNREWKVQCLTSSGAITLYSTPGFGTAGFSVFYFPSQSQAAYRPDQTPGSWSGYHDNTCSWARTNTAYGDPTADASCALVERQNRNFGTVSASGSVLPAITFNPPRAGRYWVCAYPKIAGATLAATLDVRLWDGTTVIAESESQQQVAADIEVLPICGIYNAASSTAVTLSLQTKATSGAVTIAANSTNTSALEWSVVQLDSPLAIPYLTGSVTSVTSGQERIERISFGGNSSGSSACTSSPCTIISQSGSWSAPVRASTGRYTIAVPAGQFSATPTCICSSQFIAASFCSARNATTATSISIGLDDVSGVGIDDSVNVICMGPR